MDIDNILIDEEQIFSETLIQSNKMDELLNDLVHPDGTAFVLKHPFSSIGGLDEIENWEEFGHLIKTTQRFTAFEKILHKKFPNSFVNVLKKLIREEELFQIFKDGDKIYRARSFENGMTINNQSMTSPPVQKTKNNRMSPAGISFFYGAFDEQTAIAEIRPAIGDKIVVAEFSVCNDLFVLDLSEDLGAAISIFSDNYYFNLEESIKPFLKHFISDIAKPIHYSDAVLEYLPTQAVTEYFRYHLFPDGLARIDGLMFKSSLSPQGINIVIFKGPEVSTPVENHMGVFLQYEGYKKYLVTKVNHSFELIE